MLVKEHSFIIIYKRYPKFNRYKELPVSCTCGGLQRFTYIITVQVFMVFVLSPKRARIG